jgi:hypothetical protein
VHHPVLVTPIAVTCQIIGIDDAEFAEVSERLDF